MDNFGVDPNLPNKYGDTPLHWAAQVIKNVYFWLENNVRSDWECCGDTSYIKKISTGAHKESKGFNNFA